MCKDDDRRRDYSNQKFDFLGYTFRPRLARRRQGRIGVSFSPAVSDKALKAIWREVRRWQLQKRSDKSLDDMARIFNPVIRGWINYYGRYYKSALFPTLRHIDGKLAWWACRKYKYLRRHQKLARHWLDRVARRQTACLLIGRCLWDTVGQWEPYDRRRSSTVLRERRGVIPLRHSSPASCALRRSLSV
jgi:RNA-directed DNA polymerase